MVLEQLDTVPLLRYGRMLDVWSGAEMQSQGLHLEHITCEMLFQHLNGEVKFRRISEEMARAGDAALGVRNV